MAVGPIRETQPAHPSPSAATIGEVRPNLSLEAMTSEIIPDARRLIRKSKEGLGSVESRPLKERPEVPLITYKKPRPVNNGPELPSDIEGAKGKPNFQVPVPAITLLAYLLPSINESLGKLAKQALAEQKALGQRS